MKKSLLAVMTIAAIVAFAVSIAFAANISKGVPPKLRGYDQILSEDTCVHYTQEKIVDICFIKMPVSIQITVAPQDGQDDVIQDLLRFLLWRVLAYFVRPR